MSEVKMGKRIKDVDTLNQAFEDLKYECKMLIFTSGWFIDISEDENTYLKNIMLESWSLHWRNLYEFLFINNKEKYCSGNNFLTNKYNINENEKKQLLQTWIKISELSAHLSYNRIYKRKINKHKWLPLHDFLSLTKFFNEYVKIFNEYNRINNKLDFLPATLVDLQNKYNEYWDEVINIDFHFIKRSTKDLENDFQITSVKQINDYLASDITTGTYTGDGGS